MFLATAVLFFSFQSAYSGQERRDIKSLSPEDVKAYLEGEGMGFARAAELNHYPGPRHVLDQAATLQLDDAQAAAVRRIYQRMHEEAVRLGRELVDKEMALDGLFVNGSIDSASLDKHVTKIGLLQGRLRAAHLRAHVETRAVLSAEQIRSYDALRGHHHERRHGSGERR